MRFRQVLETAATVVVAVAWFVALRPVALGGPASYIVVHGYSMSGTLAPGDLVVAMAQGSYSVGDAIVYHVPSGAGRGLLVVHRITGTNPSGYVMQGDANSYQDPWRPKASDVVGRLVWTLPGFGRVLASFANPLVLATVWGLVSLVVGLSFLPRRPATKSHGPPQLRPPTPRRLGFPTPLDGTSASAAGVMVGLVVLCALVVIYPAWNLVAPVVALAFAVTASMAGLFCLPVSSVPRPHVLISAKVPIRLRLGHDALKATTAVAVAVMVGLAMVSAEAVLAPAHAAGLTLHGGVLTALVVRCSPVPPYSGTC